MRRKRSPRTCTARGSRSASRWATLDLPAAMIPVMTTTFLSEVGGMVSPMTRTSIYQTVSIFEAAGGAEAFRALAADFHARCLADPVLEHPFSHTGNPEHVQRLADYWGEVLGGPAVFTEQCGGESAALTLHAGQGADDDLGERFAACFALAL